MSDDQKKERKTTTRRIQLFVTETDVFSMFICIDIGTDTACVLCMNCTAYVEKMWGKKQHKIREQFFLSVVLYKLSHSASNLFSVLFHGR